MKKQSKKILIVSLIIIAVLIVSFFALQIGLLFTKPQLLSVTQVTTSSDWDSSNSPLTLTQLFASQVGYMGGLDSLCFSGRGTTPFFNYHGVPAEGMNIGDLWYFLPNLDNGTKCTYCLPSVSACVKRTQDDAYEYHTCSLDGTTIAKKLCIYGCSQGTCLGEYTYNPVNIQLPSGTNDGFYGLDNVQQVRVYFEGSPYNGATINGSLYKDNTLVSQATGFSDTNGLANLTFSKVTSTGGLQLKIISKVKGVSRSINALIYVNEMPPIIMNIVPIQTNYRFGEDLGANIYVKAGASEYPNATIQVKLVNSQGATIKETSSISDEHGIAYISLSNIEFIGNTQIIATTTVFGKTYTVASSNILFTGNPFITTASASSLVQYDTAPVTFQVNIQDSFGTFYSPDLINNIRVSATLSSGTTKSPSWKYLGSGDYAITVPISGNGQFNGKLIWDYNGQTFSSDGLNIQVLKDSISIDTSRIDPSGTVNKTKTFLVSFSSASGRVIEPDKITIEVTHPSGLTIDIISQNNIVRMTNGTYQVTYDNFREIEKYSFNIYADKSGYSRGNALASVSVSGVGGGGDGVYNPVVAFIIQYIYWIIGFIVLFTGYLIWRRFKKK